MDVKHDTLAHLRTGGLGIYAEGCPRCERDGKYVSPALPSADYDAPVPGTPMACRCGQSFTWGEDSPCGHHVFPPEEGQG